MHPEKHRVEKNSGYESRKNISRPAPGQERCVFNQQVQALPIRPHLTTFPAVDQTTAKNRECGKRAEQDHVCQIPVRHDMGRRPKRQRGKQRMTRPPHDAGSCRVEQVVARATEGKRIRTPDGQRKDHADRPHDDQRHMNSPVRFEITETTRLSLERWIKDPEMIGCEYLWPSRLHASPHLSTRQYARIMRDWVLSIGLEPSAYGTHSMRRTKVAQIYKKTGNLRAVQLLLGHTKMHSTVRYLGVDLDDALSLSEGIDL